MVLIESGKYEVASGGIIFAYSIGKLDLETTAGRGNTVVGPIIVQKPIHTRKNMRGLRFFNPKNSFAERGHGRIGLFESISSSDKEHAKEVLANVISPKNKRNPYFLHSIMLQGSRWSLWMAQHNDQSGDDVLAYNVEVELAEDNVIDFCLEVPRRRFCRGGQLRYIYVHGDWETKYTAALGHHKVPVYQIDMLDKKTLPIERRIVRYERDKNWLALVPTVDVVRVRQI